MFPFTQNSESATVLSPLRQLSPPTIRKRALQGRRLVAVDLENVAGGALTTAAMAWRARSVIEEALNVVEGEQVVIGISHIGLFHAQRSWSCARVKVRSGPDGADIELIGILSTEQIETRFDEVLLASGDGIFTEAVTDLVNLGVVVTVAAWADGLSNQLRRAANHTVYLDEWADSPVGRLAA